MFVWTFTDKKKKICWLLVGFCMKKDPLKINVCKHNMITCTGQDTDAAAHGTFLNLHRASHMQISHVHMHLRHLFNAQSHVQNVAFALREKRSWIMYFFEGI